MNDNLDKNEDTYRDDNSPSCPICGEEMKEKIGWGCYKCPRCGYEE